MDDKMLLDALFVAIAVLCLPIGYGRGLPRELFVTGGLLLGVALSNAWARPWGADLADFLDIDVETGQFVVSMLFICGTTIVCGYGGAAAANLDRPRRWSRLAGAAMAVCNGALITGVVLRDIARFLTDEGTIQRIEDSEIGRILLRDFGWVLIGAAGLLFAFMIGSVLTRDRSAPAVATVATPWVAPAPLEETKGRRPRLGWGRDDGKVEPQTRGFDEATGRYIADAPSINETMPIAPIAPAAWSLDRASGPSTSYDGWIDVRRPEGIPADTSVTPPSDDIPRCVSCGERLSLGEAFCPRCGRARA
jgi:hypothetical protein